MDGKVIYFNESKISGISLPGRFTFPFFYEPHPLAKIAADDLKHYLENQARLDHNFGLDSDAQGMAIGKMFGVLIIQDGDGRQGYLSAFSGKLANSNDHPRFVPPVFDMLAEDSFFLKEQYVLNDINGQVKDIETNQDYLTLQHELKGLTAQTEKQIGDFKKLLKANKADRKKQRDEQKATLTPEAYMEFEAYMVKHSLHDKHQLNVLVGDCEARLNKLRQQLAPFEDRLEALKKERKEKSAALQQQLFEQYAFLNQYGHTRSLYDIFSETVFGTPPSAAGECATPKLLQYAFLNGYKPLAMAEFWWGASPKSEIRAHGQFYPACTGKCKPILKHMLEGIELDEDPLLVNPGENKPLDIIFEDDYFVIVNKPSGLLSVPGINISDSVYSRLKQTFKTIEPLIIHRLDMATSGLLVVAKTREAHKLIQQQFLKRTVTKRYTALLSKIIEGQEGEINLPLRGDLDDRPRQLVCFEHGKKAITRWKVIEYKDGKTKIHFWPLTGRTHQLRVHSAHEQGLNAAIVGDDLYGTAAERLYLHAAYLEFVHPASGEKMSFEVKEDF
ncbi:tRNA pseudouridine32 synthase / 23S rRNA pseudouridine746 synthase [Mucilaginibacter yixingensis]|uniref:tRNA pseudouridine32 synthase / 23S rRNA pseudouridine746 synthase n=1 Tax=Mucilaginibacter yixingensis TaxID=1295612 RepID=A0A2T5J6W8_9SPHI|nr:pseudouridine synthase [Mucilaginibacter yixingensis]PTQ94893.1 tRNA pseudouridine32 synthase / 23S rRNA pseudouridine746 synthase [Mucilaginibacter yixingensis]